MSEWIKALESMKEQLFNANHDLGRTIATQAAYIAELREALEKVNKVEQSHCYENYLSKTSTKKYVVEARFDLQQCGDIARAVLAKPAP